jgi:hypothetical protein
MAYESEAALNGVAAALLVFYAIAGGGASKLVVHHRNPVFGYLVIFCVTRVVTAALQINKNTASWNRNAAWLSFVDIGQPVLACALTHLISYGVLAAYGKISERGRVIVSMILLSASVVACRIAGAVEFAKIYQSHPASFVVPASYIVGESFNHATVAMLTIVGLVVLTQIVRTRGRSYSGTATNRPSLLGRWLEQSESREEVIVKYRDPYYLIWYATAMTLLPLFWARHIYSALSTYVGGVGYNWPFFPVSPNVGALAGLCYVPEAIITVALLVVGWRLADGPTLPTVEKPKTETTHNPGFVCTSPFQ